jgi:LytS/YehU family sensor histidine kinase
LLATPLMLAFNRARTRHFSELHEARMQAEKAQLEMLRYQLNPHFLFNTLNSVHTLIGENSTQAQEMIHSLADFCRASLYRRGEEFSRVRQELELVKNYLEIEKVRWGEELQFSVHCPEAMLDEGIPAFLFQPLVENAVKYGQLSDSSPLQVRVEVASGGEELELSVSNTGRWFSREDVRPANHSLGVGLENLKRRLERLVPTFSGMKFVEKEGWVRVTVRIPKIPWSKSEQ